MKRTQVLSLVALLAGCSQPPTTQNSGSLAPTVQASASSADSAVSAGSAASASAALPEMSDAQLSGRLADPAAPMTIEVYEALLVRVAGCRLDDGDPDWPKLVECPALERFEKETKRPHGGEGEWVAGGTGFRSATQAVAMRHLASESRALRYLAAKQIFLLFPSDPVPPVMLDRLRVETEPSVRRVLLNQLAQNTRMRQSSDCRDIGSVAEAALGDPASRVRELGLLIVGGRCVASARGDLEAAVVKLSRSDPEPTVRARARWALGGFETETALDALATCLAGKPASPPEDGCLAGALRRWTGEMQLPASPSPRAIELTLTRLAAIARGEIPAGSEPWLDSGQLAMVATLQLPPELTVALAKRLANELSAIVRQRKASQRERENAGLALVHMNELAAVTTLVTQLRAGAKSDESALAIATFLESAAQGRK